MCILCARRRLYALRLIHVRISTETYTDTDILCILYILAIFVGNRVVPSVSVRVRVRAHVCDGLPAFLNVCVQHPPANIDACAPNAPLYSLSAFVRACVCVCSTLPPTPNTPRRPNICARTVCRVDGTVHCERSYVLQGLEKRHCTHNHTSSQRAAEQPASTPKCNRCVSVCVCV